MEKIEDPEVFFYRIIERKEPSILVLGEKGEHWTDLVLRFLEQDQYLFYLFPWREIAELRLTLEVIHYPIVHLWKEGALIEECVGYNVEALKTLTRKYYRLS